jgi:hypothetical protein
MTRQQVGWYDGSRVHQMYERPVGVDPLPRHLEHTADWVAVFVGDAPAPTPCCHAAGLALESGEFVPAADLTAPLKPSLQAQAQAIGAGLSDESLEHGEPAL